MQIQYVYHYIYVPRAARATTGMPADTVAINKQFEALIEAAQSAQLAEKLKDLQKTVNRILGVIAQIPSVGIRRMLMGLVDEIMGKVSKGDIDGATDLAGKTLKLAEDCNELCYHIQNNINALANPTYVQGRAASLLKAISETAQAAMDGASCLQDLQEISDLTDRAVEIMRDLQGLDQKSPEYDKCCRELEGIMGVLSSMVTDPGMDLDQMTWQRQTGDRARDGVEKLRGKTSDAFTLSALDHLDNALADIIKAAKELPPEQAESANKALDRLLGQAGQGDVQGALRAASELAEQLQRMVKLRGFAKKRLDHLERAASAGPPGPGGEALNRVLGKLKEALERAGSPEAIAHLDKQIEDALLAAAELKNVPPGQQVRHPAYRRLLGLERELGPSSGASGEPGSPGAPGAPGLGRDSYGGLPGGWPVGPRPAPSGDILDRIPTEGLRGRNGSDIKGLDGLGAGLPSPADKEAVCGCARRAAEALATAQDAVDLALIAMDLETALEAARALRRGEDPAANREKLDGGFRPAPGSGDGASNPSGPSRPNPRVQIPPPPPTSGGSEGLEEPPDVVETPAGSDQPGSAGLAEPVNHDLVVSQG